MIPLFQAYPQLKTQLPYVSLAELPTPIHQLNNLGEMVNAEQLYIKRDDVSGLIYGGNKIRKLEFLLADAIKQQAKRVITFGFAGSNHALATAIYAHFLGIHTTSMLMPQINAQYVRRNLLASHDYGADIHQHQTQLELAIHTAYQLIHYTLKEGHIPYIIAPGGSSPLGAIAYVNAAFELKEQIVQGQIPEPDFIYLPLGTMGTAVGLVLGLKAIGLKTKVIGVRVVEAQFANEQKMVNLFNRTNSLLHSLDPDFPILKIAEKDFCISLDFFGKNYAQFTESGMKAMMLMNEYEKIPLDGTYTGKTFAALIHDINQEDIKHKVILFWNTYNSRNLPSASISEDFHHLPQSLHHYFIDNLQPLDQLYK
ncbi:1-aminocyclopropane-1-carboxylate deaminase/D-cysteine desulfhydrase [Anabaena azotica]|uniref:Pyridoxal-phosphate dependent enzyme n=1 Tax=Anabaena azotica FACHB-119 TaxID=947527 RepID=A0ABR8DAT7_9NOST|nr:pyridoxal-phosphate dependent enzyme [Anabaena azotica]MBD2503317.1 pyridoxal-phosphate dependent enzyme [Anabaena azotica FACHB-119]